MSQLCPDSEGIWCLCTFVFFNVRAFLMGRRKEPIHCGLLLKNLVLHLIAAPKALSGRTLTMSRAAGHSERILRSPTLFIGAVDQSRCNCSVTSITCVQKKEGESHCIRDNRNQRAGTGQ
jgi:hypothetical protein